MREMLRGMRGGFQSMPADQRAQIAAKAKNLGARELVQYAEGYGLGILEGLWLGLKGLGEAVVTLVTLPGEVNRFVFETVPELAVKYGPRLMLAMNEANGLSGRLTSALADVLSRPAQLGELIEAFKGIALVKVRAIGHGLAGKIVDLVAEPWYDYGHDVGKIVGQILFEVLLAVASDAIANLVKEVLSVIGRLMARLIEGAVEVFRTLRRLFGDALAWLGKLAGRMTGTLAEAFKDAERFIARLGTIFEDLAGERALADTGTGIHVPIPDAKGPTVLESRAVKPPGGGGGGNTKAADLTHSSTAPDGGPHHGPGAAHVHDESFSANRTFEGSEKHSGKDRKVGDRKVAKEPTDGPAALDFSFQVSNNSPRRIGIDVKNNEFVVFDRTGNKVVNKEVTGGVFHGHVRSWDELEAPMKKLLTDRGLVKNGKITVDPTRWVVP